MGVQEARSVPERGWGAKRKTVFKEELAGIRIGDRVGSKNKKKVNVIDYCSNNRYRLWGTYCVVGKSHMLVSKILIISSRLSKPYKTEVLISVLQVRVMNFIKNRTGILAQDCLLNILIPSSLQLFHHRPLSPLFLFHIIVVCIGRGKTEDEVCRKLRFMYMASHLILTDL